jgi:hypothetical protein
MCSVAPLQTVGTISTRFGVAIHKVKYIISARKIQPVARAGHAHVYDDAAVARIGEELRLLEVQDDASDD